MDSGTEMNLFQKYQIQKELDFIFLEENLMSLLPYVSAD